MTRQHEDPFAYLPIVIPGLLVGLGLVLGGGVLAAAQIDASSPPTAAAGQATIRGTVAWAGWRQSAAADGPAWFLQVRLDGDPRGFLVSASDLTATFRDRHDQSGPARGTRRPLSGLEGKDAVIVVDDRFQERPRPSTPYMQALRIGGTVVAPLRPDASSEGPSTGFLLLLGAGVLAGLGLTSVSLHHIAVCVRHARRS
jgi:hypothetical protein